MRGRRHGQRGVSLVSVLVLLLLSLWLAYWASRSAHFHEMLAGSESDYQRALEAAQAALRDAEFDLRGERPDGTPCASAAAARCRPRTLDVASGQAFFPETREDFRALESAVAGRTPACIAGICASDRLAAEFWKVESGALGLGAMKRVAAHYGQYTGAIGGPRGNPLLRSDAGAERKAWYWIEVLPYATAAAVNPGNAQRFAPDATRPFVYRITALAQGLKPGTQAVVQAVVVWRQVDS